jgi:hypothetical protein
VQLNNGSSLSRLIGLEKLILSVFIHPAIANSSYSYQLLECTAGTIDSLLPSSPLARVSPQYTFLSFFENCNPKKAVNTWAGLLCVWNRFSPYECTGGGERRFGERINKPVLERAYELWICGLVVDDICKLCFICVNQVFSSETQSDFRGSSLESSDFGEDFVTHSGIETARLSKCVDRWTYHWYCWI